MYIAARYNPEWRKRKNTCCCFCGETRSVKYEVDFPNFYGERVLTVDACNRCVLLIDKQRKEDEKNV